MVAPVPVCILVLLGEGDGEVAELGSGHDLCDPERELELNVRRKVLDIQRRLKETCRVQRNQQSRGIMRIGHAPSHFLAFCIWGGVGP